MKAVTLAVAAALLVGGSAIAQDGHGAMAKQEYVAGMHRMHQAMMKADDADPDRAFALKMIEHHRGAIAMADVLLKHGDDAELNQMAQTAKAEQEKEIKDLQAWLDRHGGQAPKR